MITQLINLLLIRLSSSNMHFKEINSLLRSWPGQSYMLYRGGALKIFASRRLLWV